MHRRGVVAPEQARSREFKSEKKKAREAPSLDSTSMDVNAAKTAVHGTFQNLVNAVKPIPTVSTFLQEGDLTPDEACVSSTCECWLIP